MPTRDEAWPQGTPCWVDLSVDDLPQARAFYGALFGWEIPDGAPEAGGYLIAHLDGRTVAGIGPKPAGMPMPSAWTTYLAVEDADATAAKVTDAGGQVIAPVFDVLDAGRMAVLADPTGAVFAIWQAKSHLGAGVYNQPGAYVWNELHTRDYRSAQEFYRSVFGYAFNEIGDGEFMTYSTFSLPGASAAEPVGGAADDSKQPGEGAYWLTWFQSANVDDTLTQATELGASVLMPAADTPFGRMAIVQGVQGEVFGLITQTS